MIFVLFGLRLPCVSSIFRLARRWQRPSRSLVLKFPSDSPLTQCKLFQIIEQRGQAQNPRSCIDGRLTGNLRLREICCHRGHVCARQSIFLLAQVQPIIIQIQPRKRDVRPHFVAHPQLAAVGCFPPRSAPQISPNSFRCTYIRILSAASPLFSNTSTKTPGGRGIFPALLSPVPPATGSSRSLPSESHGSSLSSDRRAHAPSTPASPGLPPPAFRRETVCAAR
jgi:hypothetical protein